MKCGRIRKRLLFEVQDFVRKFNPATDFDSIEILKKKTFKIKNKKILTAGRQGSGSTKKIIKK